MTRRAGALILALVLATGGSAIAVAKRTFTPLDSRDTAPQIIHKGGVIRLGPEVYIHENETHASVGFTALRTEDCGIVVTLDYTPGSKVIAAVVDEDERVSQLGVQAGISGGNTQARIELWRDGVRVCPGWSQFGNNGNLWVSITTLDAPEPSP